MWKSIDLASDFASHDIPTGVQEQSTSFDYKVRLNNDAISGNTLLINVGAGVAAQTTGTIADETTIVLIFKSSGTLTKKIEYNASGGTPQTTNY